MFQMETRGGKHGGQKMTNISGMAVISLCLRSVMNMVWLNDNLQLVGILQCFIEVLHNMI